MELEKNLQKIIQQAYNEAVRYKHEYFIPEHILFATITNNSGKELLTKCGGNPEYIKEKCKSFFLSNYIPTNDNKKPIESLDMQTIINSSIEHSINAQKKVVELGDILISIIELENSFAAYFLKKSGINKLNILEYISHDIDKTETNTKNNILSKYTTDLTAKAKNNELEPFIGRKRILEKTILTLCRRTKNNPIHVGEAGVGKTAITEGLAQLIVKNEVPNKLKNSKIFLLDLASIIAGTRFRGDFEKRFKLILEELNKIDNVILFIDEIHNIIGMGSISGNSLDASNLLKPILTNSKLKCIGATTYSDYRKYFEKDNALVRRFNKIDIPEPSKEDTLKILKGLKNKYEEYHKVKYNNDSLKTIIDLTSKYINDKFLPDKAIDILDESGAMLNISKSNKKIVNSKTIEKVISKKIKIPEKTIVKSEISELKNLEKNLKKEIFGQDYAIEKLVEVIKYSRANLNNAYKPIGSLLFAGPTGVGKTELSKQLAKLLNIKLIRFDMSEYQEKHTISRLIGSPPGYVGFDQGGLLTEEIRKHPHSILLLDEIEKAHLDIFNSLLQIMDYATLTDSSGRKADFKNTIIIMTSNAGARNISKTNLGFNNSDIPNDAINKAIKKTFSPEFINRLNYIVEFNNLNNDICKKIVKKEIKEFKENLKLKNISLTIDKESIEWLAEKGYSKKYGAREIERIIFDNIKKKFVDEILFGKLTNGGESTISLKNNKLHFKFKKK